MPPFYRGTELVNFIQLIIKLRLNIIYKTFLSQRNERDVSVNHPDKPMLSKSQEKKC